MVQLQTFRRAHPSFVHALKMVLNGPFDSLSLSSGTAVTASGLETERELLVAARNRVAGEAGVRLIVDQVADVVDEPGRC